jgi:uncharacterized iron-regulated membrane protein
MNDDELWGILFFAWTAGVALLVLVAGVWLWVLS